MFICGRRPNTGTVRINAYVLAGSPAWIAESIESYYQYIDKLVVCFDRDNLSWDGHPLEVPEALERLRALDTEGKIIELPGQFSDPGRFALDTETDQRQQALDLASHDADWVLQIDTDEVLASPERFFLTLKTADGEGFDALHYPARWWYQRAGQGSSKFLERSRRFGKIASDYPGPIAVRAGTMLTHCRQTDASCYRVDFDTRNTDPAHPADVVVHEAILPDEGVIHLSWLRSAEQMDAKRFWSGHAGQVNMNKRIERWHAAYRRPRLTVMLGPFHRHPDFWMRIVDSPISLRSGDWLP